MRKDSQKLVTPVRWLVMLLLAGLEFAVPAASQNFPFDGTPRLPYAVASAHDDARNLLQIHVIDPEGADLPNMIHVELLSGDMPGFGARGREGYCDSKGYYSFSELPDGNYTVVVSIPGRLPQRRDVAVSHGTEAQLNFQVGAAVEVAPDEDSPTVSVQWLAIPEKARKRYAKARERYDRNDYKGALKDLQAALSIDAEFAIAYNLTGLCHWRMKNYDQAKDAFDNAIRIEPKFMPARLNEAEVLLQQKDFAGAAKVVQEANRQQPNRAEPFYEIAKIQFATGNLDHAEEACHEALKRDASKVPDAHIILSNIYLRKDDVERVTAELQTYLEVAPQGRFAETARAKLAQIKQLQAEGQLHKPVTPGPASFQNQ